MFTAIIPFDPFMILLALESFCSIKSCKIGPFDLTMYQKRIEKVKSSLSHIKARIESLNQKFSAINEIPPTEAEAIRKEYIKLLLAFGAELLPNGIIDKKKNHILHAINAEFLGFIYMVSSNVTSLLVIPWLL